MASSASTRDSTVAAVRCSVGRSTDAPSSRASRPHASASSLERGASSPGPSTRSDMRGIESAGLCCTCIEVATTLSDAKTMPCTAPKEVMASECAIKPRG